MQIRRTGCTRERLTNAVCWHSLHAIRTPFGIRTSLAEWIDMGIVNALRGRRPHDGDAGAGVGPGDPAAPDPIDFRPRTDGIYLAESEALQFTGSSVREASGVADQAVARAALAGLDVRTGEYTSTGRFSVGAPFEMLVAVTVTEIGDDFFLARRTDAKDRSIAELRYTFLANG